ncbi:MAG: diacylglycerol kinase family protein [Candidatus Saccharimonadales bacterium]
MNNAQKIHVWIIYNPNSTGDSKSKAHAFSALLKKHKVQATCIPTEYAGHAEKIAKKTAESEPNPIIFSSSGDGGYNEVINGVLASNAPKTICGVLPAGNANDHYHAVHRGHVAKRVAAGDFDVIDCIAVDIGKVTRYAHSYIGLGLTPQIGQELTKRKLSPVVEAWVVFTKLFRITPVKISYDGKVQFYDHLVISNIPKMAKYISIAPNANISDGLLELTTVRSGSFITLLRHLLKRIVSADADPKQIEAFEFICERATTLQLDGEVVRLMNGQKVTVRCAPKHLRTIS